jgi:acetyl esterase
MISTVFEALGRAMPIAEGVTTTTVTIAGGDGQDLTLYVSRLDTAGRLACVVHLHGGGMAILSATDTAIMRGRECIAATGLVVVGVEFRNSAGKLGVHPYPAGLNDCAAAVRWVFANREGLGITHLIVAGESGGGNLTLTVTHKAKREGWLDEIAGAYAQCPYISNRWREQPDGFPSMKENDGYFISCAQLAILASVYDPENARSDDPTCWAGVATDEDLSGLPPHVISVNELDPLRDEGLDYYRRLAGAGVPAIGRVVAGTCHGGDMLLAGAMPTSSPRACATSAGSPSHLPRVRARPVHGESACAPDVMPRLTAPGTRRRRQRRAAVVDSVHRRGDRGERMHGRVAASDRTLTRAVTACPTRVSMHLWHFMIASYSSRRSSRLCVARDRGADVVLGVAQQDCGLGAFEAIGSAGAAGVTSV